MHLYSLRKHTSDSTLILILYMCRGIPAHTHWTSLYRIELIIIYEDNTLIITNDDIINLDMSLIYFLVS